MSFCKEKFFQRFVNTNCFQQVRNDKVVEHKLAEDVQHVLSRDETKKKVELMFIRSFVIKVRSFEFQANKSVKLINATHILFTNRAVGSVDNGSLAQYWRPPTTALSIYLYSSRYCEQSIKNLFGSKTKPFKSKNQTKTFTFRFTFCIPPEIGVLSSCWSFLGQSSRSVCCKVKFNEKINLFDGF